MHIDFIEIQNFRKLKSIRIDFSSEKTLFVGANNSGKTSAMVALRRFLIDHRNFNTNDFTLSSWKKINKIGLGWENKSDSADDDTFSLNLWEGTLPSMDVWLHVQPNEIHYVQHLLPSLDWEGGVLGVRLQLEPKELGELHKEYFWVRKAAQITISEAQKTKKNHDYKVPLWPSCMRDFLERGLNTKFVVRAYSLDPTKLTDPENGFANPQKVIDETEFLEGNPFEGLIRIDAINAQRGFADANNVRESNESSEETSARGYERKLSEQLRSYYTKHLDPNEMPEASDVDALEAIHHAQTVFNEKLKIGFEHAFKEIESLGYPGISNPKLTISTNIKPIDGMKHPSALQYDVIPHHKGITEIPPRLPEQYNGLGYQNLISMVFRLMRFRDDWLQIGKASKVAATKNADSAFLPPLHLVLVEEPEAHLHVQVQQVFIRKAYEILRNNEHLQDNKSLTTQLVVSTHSSHIAHECDFSYLRYFRRKPATKLNEVPTSTVISLSKVFGNKNETERFVARYLKANHCDLFFADAAILIEGATERMLVPHFIRNRFKELNQSYITLLEIGGSHAHRLQPLIEHLGLNTLIISDIDAANANTKKSEPIVRNTNQITSNSTLKFWVPKKENIDELLDVSKTDKIKKYDEFFSVAVAFQGPVQVKIADDKSETEILPTTFEDSLILENITLLKTLEGIGLVKKIKTSIATSKTGVALSQALFNDLKSGNKAKFALDLLFLCEPDELSVPKYISEGLCWLQKRLEIRQNELMIEE